MERRLLPEDRATLDQKLSALISLAEETIFEETVGQDLEGTGAFGSLNEPQKATLRELCIRGGCHPSLIAALKDAAKANGLEALLEAAANLFEAQRGDGTPAPKDSEQLDACFPIPNWMTWRGVFWETEAGSQTTALTAPATAGISASIWTGTFPKP